MGACLEEETEILRILEMASGPGVRHWNQLSFQVPSLPHCVLMLTLLPEGYAAGCLFRSGCIACDRQLR